MLVGGGTGVSGSLVGSGTGVFVACGRDGPPPGFGVSVGMGAGVAVGKGTKACVGVGEGLAARAVAVAWKGRRSGSMLDCVGRSVGGAADGIAVGVAVGEGVKVGVSVGVAVSVALAVGVGVAVGIPLPLAPRVPHQMPTPIKQKANRLAPAKRPIRLRVTPFQGQNGLDRDGACSSAVSILEDSVLSVSAWLDRDESNSAWCISATPWNR